MSEESGEKVPIWIISFADMITLLLAFFVMLQTMSKQREPALFKAGQGSFIRAIEGFGIPDLLMGKQSPAPLDYRKIKYPTAAAEDAKPKNRTIDAEDEELRLAFQDLQQRFSGQASDVYERIIELSASPIRFESSSAELDANAQGYLKGLAANLKVDSDRRGLRVYVIGLAADEVPGKGQWFQSARRAQAVEALLRSELSVQLDQGGWEIQSFGAGEGGHWCRKLGIAPRDAFIVVAVTQVSTNHG
jgi:flagellar motor protein MotB